MAQEKSLSLRDKLKQVDEIEQRLNLAGFRFAVKSEELVGGEKLTSDKVVDFALFAAKRIEQIVDGEVKVAKAFPNPPTLL